MALYTPNDWFSTPHQNDVAVANVLAQIEKEEVFVAIFLNVTQMLKTDSVTAKLTMFCTWLKKRLEKEEVSIGKTKLNQIIGYALNEAGFNSHLNRQKILQILTIDTQEQTWIGLRAKEAGNSLSAVSLKPRRMVLSLPQKATVQ